jgi:isopenicillin-N N-acyltransferase-like protein
MPFQHSVICRLPFAALLFCAVSQLPAEQPATGGRVYAEGTSGQGRLEYIQGQPVMFLAGSPEEIGRQQAELVGDTIGPLLDMPKKTLARFGYERAWPLAVGMSNLLMEHAPKDHRTELDTFIAAGKLDRGGLYVGNSMVELRRMGGCSSYVVLPEKSATGELIFGRNFDFPPLGVLDSMHCLLVVRPDGKRPYVSIGYPGLIGVISGINDAGLVVATLDVYQSADGSPFFDSTGTPLALTYRRILEECATVQEAGELLKNAKRTTYMNLAVADAKSAVVFELTPKSVGVRQALGGVVACTNHFQLDGLCIGGECYRIHRLNDLTARSQKLDIPAVQKALHSVHQGEMTLQTMIFEPKSLRLHVAMGGGVGPVSDDPMETFELKEWLGRTSATENAAPAGDR